MEQFAVKEYNINYFIVHILYHKDAITLTELRVWTLHSEQHIQWAQWAKLNLESVNTITKVKQCI